MRLRVTIKPNTSTHTEWLTYSFTDKQPDGCNVVLAWAKKSVSFSVKVPNVDDVILQSMKEEMAEMSDKDKSDAYIEMTIFALEHDKFKDHWLDWMNTSIELNEWYFNLRIKAMALSELGREEEAKATIERMMEVANEQQLNAYAYEIMGNGDVDRALEIFKLNLEKNPKSWNAYDSLAEAYAQKGKKSQAKKYYKKALSLAPESQHARINKALETL